MHKPLVTDAHQVAMVRPSRFVRGGVRMRGVIGAPAVLMAFVASFPSCTRPQEKPATPPVQIPAAQMPAPPIPGSPMPGSPIPGSPMPGAQVPSRQVVPPVLSPAQFQPAQMAPFEQVALGRPVPDIVGRDLDGAPMRLSDHRGKIIVLLFSGHW